MVYVMFCYFCLYLSYCDNFWVVSFSFESGQQFGFISFLLIISWYLNRYESSNTTMRHVHIIHLVSFVWICSIVAWNAHHLLQFMKPLHHVIGSLKFNRMPSNHIVSDSSLQYIGETVGINQPHHILLNEERGRPDVIENNNKSLTVFDN